MIVKEFIFIIILLIIVNLLYQTLNGELILLSAFLIVCFFVVSFFEKEIGLNLFQKDTKSDSITALEVIHDSLDEFKNNQAQMIAGVLGSVSSAGANPAAGATVTPPGGGAGAGPPGAGPPDADVQSRFNRFIAENNVKIYNIYNTNTHFHIIKQLDNSYIMEVVETNNNIIVSSALELSYHTHTNQKLYLTYFYNRSINYKWDIKVCAIYDTNFFHVKIKPFFYYNTKELVYDNTNNTLSLEDNQEPDNCRARKSIIFTPTT